ncbi:unnamed protein product [Amoebophrya sp. A120]|nr:unnamed protein product [Amoebophrya sp. A120]|eukprot:GSA120T00016149001.1
MMYNSKPGKQYHGGKNNRNRQSPYYGGVGKTGGGLAPLSKGKMGRAQGMGEAIGPPGLIQDGNPSYGNMGHLQQDYYNQGASWGGAPMMDHKGGGGKGGAKFGGGKYNSSYNTWHHHDPTSQAKPARTKGRQPTESTVVARVQKREGLTPEDIEDAAADMAIAGGYSVPDRVEFVSNTLCFIEFPSADAAKKCFAEGQSKKLEVNGQTLDFVNYGGAADVNAEKESDTIKLRHIEEISEKDIRKIFEELVPNSILFVKMIKHKPPQEYDWWGNPVPPNPQTQTTKGQKQQMEQMQNQFAFVTCKSQPTAKLVMDRFKSQKQSKINDTFVDPHFAKASAQVQFERDQANLPAVLQATKLPKKHISLLAQEPELLKLMQEKNDDKSGPSNPFLSSSSAGGNNSTSAAVSAILEKEENTNSSMWASYLKKFEGANGAKATTTAAVSNSRINGGGGAAASANAGATASSAGVLVPPGGGNSGGATGSTSSGDSKPMDKSLPRGRKLMNVWNPDETQTAIWTTVDNEGLTMYFDSERGFFFDANAIYFQYEKESRVLIQVDSKGKIKEDCAKLPLKHLPASWKHEFGLVIQPNPVQSPQLGAAASTVESGQTGAPPGVPGGSPPNSTDATYNNPQLQQDASFPVNVTGTSSTMPSTSAVDDPSTTAPPPLSATASSMRNAMAAASMEQSQLNDRMNQQRLPSPNSQPQQHSSSMLYNNQMTQQQNMNPSQQQQQQQRPPPSFSTGSNSIPLGKPSPQFAPQPAPTDSRGPVSFQDIYNATSHHQQLRQQQVQQQQHLLAPQGQQPQQNLGTMLNTKKQPAVFASESDEEDMELSDAEDVPEPEEEREYICYLCQRKFPHAAALIRHENESDLHKRNLAAKAAREQEAMAAAASAVR